MSDLSVRLLAADRRLRAVPARVWITLVVALVAGLGLRERTFNRTDDIRSAINQRNAFYWGDRIAPARRREREPA